MPAKSKEILALVVHLGYQLKQGSKHIKAINPSTGNFTTIPRHTVVSNGVVDNICKFLIQEGADKKTIKKFIN